MVMRRRRRRIIIITMLVEVVIKMVMMILLVFVWFTGVGWVSRSFYLWEETQIIAPTNDR